MTKQEGAGFPPRNLANMIESHDILEFYKEPNSQVDIGNVYFAACTFRDEVLRLESILQAEQEKCKLLREALNNFLKKYVELVDSGDAGFWDAEKEPEVIAARAALKEATSAEGEA